MKTLYAVLVTYTAGYESEQDEIKRLMKIGDKFPIEHITINGYSSKIDIVINDVFFSFNSVFFDVVDQDGKPYDFIADVDYLDDVIEHAYLAKYGLSRRPKGE